MSAGAALTGRLDWGWRICFQVVHSQLGKMVWPLVDSVCCITGLSIGFLECPHKVVGDWLLLQGQSHSVF